MAVSLAVPNRDAQPVGRASFPDQDAAIEQRLPDSVPVGEPAEEHKVRVRVRGLQPERAQVADESVALGANRRDRGQQLSGVMQRGARDGLGDGRQVIGKPNKQ